MAERALPVEIACIPSARSLSLHASSVLADVARVQSLHAGEQLFRQGEPCGGLMLLLRGFARLSRAEPAGRDLTVAIVGPGDVLAQAALLGAAVHANSAAAVTNARIIEVPAESLDSLGERCPDVLAYLVTRLAARVGKGYGDAAADTGLLTDRLLRLLRQFSEQREPVESFGGAMQPLVWRFSHAELAHLVAAERASVTRALHELETRGLIERERGHVVQVMGESARQAALTTP